MSKITKIEKQKKEGRYNIFLDGEFAFGLYKETIFHYGLRTKDSLEENRINEIRDFDEYNFGKKVAYCFLNYKQRSEKEVRKKLTEKKISPHNSEKIIESLKELKFIDDRNYAKLYLEDKLTHKPEGKRKLTIKLAGKGITKETIDDTMGKIYDEETEFKKAEEVLRKYFVKLKQMKPLEKKQKCFRHLLSKGFDYEIINNVLRESDFF